MEKARSRVTLGAMEAVPAGRPWKSLLARLRPDRPPGMSLYVPPKLSCAEDVVRELLADPESSPKFLLVGARGGGKSTELRAISERLKDKLALVEIDLDQSGVQATSVSAYDLLYVSAVALLKLLPEGSGKAKELFEELALRYAGGESEKSRLGSLSEALGGISNFAGVATAAATAMGLATGAAPVMGVVAAFVGQGLKLFSGRSGVVMESSPQGRALQEAARQIALAVSQHVQRPLCVLIDGLEKMNGEAAERFKEVFEDTRLLADTEWASVIAAPPSTLTKTSSVDGRGFTTKTVWGFGLDDLESLQAMLSKRWRDAGFTPEHDVVAGGLRRMAELSGGMPRYAIMLARSAVLRAAAEEAARLEEQHLEAAIQEVGETLGRGLNDEHEKVLRYVHTKGTLPGSKDAATLFANGRILAYPPLPTSRKPRWAVHPLLRADIERGLREGGETE